MKNTMKKYGFIALLAVVAVIAIGFTACEEPEEWDIWIEAKDDRPITGSELTAVSGKTGLAYYQWYKDGTALPGEVIATFTPTEAGIYTVSANKAEKTSAGFKVIKVDANVVVNAEKYIGKWKMDGTKAGATWTDSYGTASEYLEITWTSFKIDSEFVDDNGNKEYWYFDIDEWQNATVNGTAGFTRFGVKLIGTTDKQIGYNSDDFTNFHLFTNMPNDNQIRRFNATISGTTPIARTYDKQ